MNRSIRTTRFLFGAAVFSGAVALSMLFPYSTQAQQTPIPITPIAEVKCGDILDGSFAQDFQNEIYTINLNSGDAATVSAKAYGKTLKFSMAIFGPTQILVVTEDDLKDSITLKSDVLSARGTYYFRILNANTIPSGDRDNNNKQSNELIFNGSTGYNSKGGVGDYTLYVGCTLRDGTVINPGDKSAGNVSGGQATATAPGAVAAAPFTGLGFPGLPSVDFSNAVTVSLQSAGSTGKLPPTGNTVLGYTFQGKAKGTVNLSFTRTVGNLNLGLVVLSADNKVIFQASLVNSTALTTQFTLPSDGEYTIGIFKIDLLPPDKPVATSFQLQGNLS